MALRITTFGQSELFDQLLAEMTPRAFGKKGVARVQFHPRLEILGRLAVFADADVARRHTPNRAILVKQNLPRRKAWVDLDAQRLGLLPQPADHVAQAHHVIAMIAEAVGQQPVRHLPGTPRRQKHEAIFAHFGMDGRALALPVGQQFVDRPGVHHRPRQGVRADFGAFFQDADANVLATAGGELLDADRGSESRRTPADDHHVVFHCVAFDLHAVLQPG